MEYTYNSEMGYAFLMRNYRSDTGKWQTSDPLGYPDGWNNYAYCNNEITETIDLFGAKVYWCARDLDGIPVGNHHYLVFIPDNPNDFSGLKTYANGQKGYTIGGFNRNNKLNYEKNHNTDTEAINEYFGGPDKGWDPEFHEVLAPKEMTDTQFINLLQEIADSYKNDTYNFDLQDQNCASWVNSVLDIAGIPKNLRDQYGEFFGVDWGEENLLPRSAFTYE